ncbi:MAG: zinc ribbon domain-containing protein [Deltaproteobacteria bacterium]|nr:zinc ribbon domain-containing protein [Deltaproteobacteria bacterium]MBW2016164.1 zinc ribbon domain-containing protein [Deltaproteobacteria bacterium]MBW2130080.1 zinc ribbon domain-containing protein [Deltaproteobacteria bacterium]MBW2302560.1 zinc ribbon domain-containing protein [Deltaproteobacteria bacterium]
MPIYEYECLACATQFQKLIMSKDQESELQCPKCGGNQYKKLISRVAYHVSEQDRLASFDPHAAKTDAFYRDTRNIGLAAKKRAQEMGVSLGEGFEAKLDKLRTDPGSLLKE